MGGADGSDRGADGADGAAGARLRDMADGVDRPDRAEGRDGADEADGSVLHPFRIMLHTRRREVNLLFCEIFPRPGGVCSASAVLSKTVEEFIFKGC